MLPSTALSRRREEKTKTHSDCVHMVRIMGWELANTFFRGVFHIESGGCIIYRPSWDTFASEGGVLLILALEQQALNWDRPWQTGTCGSLEQVSGDVRQAVESPAGAKPPPPGHLCPGRCLLHQPAARQGSSLAQAATVQLRTASLGENHTSTSAVRTQSWSALPLGSH